MKVYADLHTHTINSDGKNTIDENIRAAKARGLKQVAITNHSHWKLKRGKRREQILNITKAQTKKSGLEHGIEALFGIECNILNEAGDIDISTKERGMFDIVVCGIHPAVRPRNMFHWWGFFFPNLFWQFLRKLKINFTPKSRIRRNTRAVVNAIERNNIDILSHPNRYFRVNVIEVAQACMNRGTVMELNNKKISYRPVDFERMAAMGVKFIINSDAHKAENVGRMDRVKEFLKLCDYDPSCIINLNKPFKRPEGKILKQIIEDEDNGSDQV